MTALDHPPPADASATIAPKRAPRSLLRSVGVPTEHGGWGITTEVIVLGLVVAPSGAGVGIAVAALLSFLARTPLKVVLVDLRRGRRLPRTVVAGRLFAAEGLVIVTAALLALRWGASGFWLPLIAMVPALATELAFDMRSRSRRLVPELAGSIGIGGVAAMIVLAGGRSGPVAIGLWLVLAARSISAIVTVRAQVKALHGRPVNPWGRRGADAAALGVAAAATLVEPVLLAGSGAVAVAILVQHLLDRWPTERAVVLGLRQTALGLSVVLVTALGVVLS